MADSLAERLLRGDKRALARGISLVEDDDPDGWALVKAIYPHTGNAAIVGFTGPPGAGKSTLIGALIKHQRALERQIAVLSIDPSSPFRGGALLGDRIRLSEHFLDPGVFIRSMATRGALGGLAEAALQAALLMDAAGKDDVYLETVGVGQAEVDVIDHADSVVLVLIPGSGDSIQALKAGVMEIPDIIVVNKSDHPLTDTMVREIRGVLSLAPQEGWRVPIVKTEAARGEGVDVLATKLRRAPRPRRGRGHAVRAPTSQPDERGARDRHRAAAARARGHAARRRRGPGTARRGRRTAAGSRERGERRARPRRDRSGRRPRPAAPPAHPTRPYAAESFVQFALQSGRRGPRVAPCGGRSVRSPAPSASGRRCVPLPSQRRRTGSSRRSSTAGWSLLNPDGSALRTLTGDRAGRASPSWRGRRTATGSRSCTAGGSRSIEFATGRYVGDHGRGRRREPRLVGGRHADRVPARAVHLRRCLRRGGTPPQLHSFVLDAGHDADRLAARPGRDRRGRDRRRAAGRRAGRWSSGRPAYVADGSRIAFADRDGLSTIPAAGGEPVRGRAGARRSRRAGRRTGPRSSIPPPASCARSSSAAGPGRVPVAGARDARVDWQPCVDGRDR